MEEGGGRRRALQTLFYRIQLPEDFTVQYSSKQSFLLSLAFILDQVCTDLHQYTSEAWGMTEEDST